MFIRGIRTAWLVPDTTQISTGIKSDIHILSLLPKHLMILLEWISSNNHVYTWYRDGTTSSGHSSDLGAYRAPYKFTLAYGQISPDDIVGMGIMHTPTADHVITWCKDGTVSSGHSEDLDYFYTQPWHIDRGWSSLRRGEWRGLIDIAVDATGRTFAWWRDCTGEVYSNPRVGSAQGSKPFGWRQSVDR